MVMDGEEELDKQEQDGEKSFCRLCSELTKVVMSNEHRLSMEWLVLSCLVVGSEILARYPDEELRDELSKKLVKDFPSIMKTAMTNWNEDVVEVHRIQ
jgi:hypothetical protein